MGPDRRARPSEAGRISGRGGEHRDSFYSPSFLALARVRDGPGQRAGWSQNEKKVNETSIEILIEVCVY